jgi:hypothetical protein
MTEVRPSSGTPPPADYHAADSAQQSAQQSQQTQQTSQQQQQTDQTQKDQAAKAAEEARQAQEAQAAQARQAAVDAIRQQGSSGPTLPQDFMGVLDNIVKEGYETAKPPEGGKTGDQGQDGATNTQKNMAQEMQRDLQTIREFVREAKYMVTNQGMEVAQMLNMMKVEQGGAFWQKIQQILQKGIPVEKQVLFQKLDKPVTELPKSLTSAPGSDAALKAAMGGATNLGDMAKMTPGQAILELLKAEGNPTAQLEHFLAAMTILNRDGLQESAKKLRSYLRRRGDWTPEQEIRYFRGEDQKKEIFQGPMPREEFRPVNFWYLLLAIGTFGASLGLGLNIMEAAVVGVFSALIMFLLALLFR